MSQTSKRHGIADFSKRAGMIRKDLHSSNFTPGIGAQAVRNFNEPFKKLHYTYSRAHDLMYTNPACRLADTSMIFSNMHDDPADPRNYYFEQTDFLFENLKSCGTDIFYQLGESFEHKLKPFNARQPENFEKYAEVLAGIVRHYNRGWANGYRWDIKYWEIWNEPDLIGKAWCGPLDEYYHFYSVAAKRLKKEFPEIKVGGPAFCTCIPRVELIRAFLKRTGEEDAPVDFFSWHCYTDDIENLLAQPALVRKVLDEEGYTKTETSLNEWHYTVNIDSIMHYGTPEQYRNAMFGPRGLHGIDSVAFTAAVEAGFQDTPLDTAFFYGCDLFVWGFLNNDGSLNKIYHAVEMTGKLVSEYPNRIYAKSNYKPVYLLGGTDSSGSKCALMVSDYRGTDPELLIELPGIAAPRNLVATILDQEHYPTEIPARLEDGRLRLKKFVPSESAVFFVTFEK